VVCLVEGGYGGEVEGEVAERGAVVGALGEGAAGEVEVVGGAEEEDTFSVWVGVSGGVRRGGMEGEDTLWRGRGTCRPRRRWGQSRSNRHVWR